MPKAGTKLYRTIWADFPPDLLWYEPIEYVKDTSKAFMLEYQRQLELEAQQDADYAQEEADLEQMEEEDLPMP